MSAELVTLVIGLLTLAGGQIATALVLVGRMDRQAEETNRRFDDLTRAFADLRERMARLEGSLEGFVAGRRDRGVT